MHNTDDVQEKIDFFLVSAHELRTSLSAMKWLFDMLLHGDLGPLTDAQKQMLAQAKGSNEHMIELVNDTMMVVRTDGGVPYQQLPVHMDEILACAVRDFTNEAAGKGMHIRYSCEPVGTVIGDEQKLRITVHNLLENAIKYGRPDTDISINLGVVDTMLELRITNKGVGIPDGEQDKIFGKFYRASNVRDTTPGVGLGLYATKHIVERHGGGLTFTSTDGITTFTILLPLKH